MYIRRKKKERNLAQQKQTLIDDTEMSNKGYYVRESDTSRSGL